MKLFGYEINDSIIHVRPDFTELAAPYFYVGNKIGCLVLHGIGGTPANVRAVADMLVKRGYTVYAPMLAGHGTTVADLHEVRWTDWVRSVYDGYEKLREAGCERIIPFGLSLGGVLSAYLAATKPCAGLFMFSPPIRMKPFLRATCVLSPVIHYVNYDQEHEREVQRKNPYSQMYYGMSTKSVLELQRLLLKLIPKLPSISCPVYAIWAENDDKVNPDSSRILKRRLLAPYKEYTIPDCPHGSTYCSKRDEVVAAAERFLDELLPKEE